MRIGIIAEGHADMVVVKSVLKALTGIDTADMRAIRPTELLDETDKSEMNFSNWGLVMQSAADAELLAGFFDSFGDEAILVLHIDTAERGEVGYDVREPQRSGHPDWKEYSVSLRSNVKSKLEALVPMEYRERVAYAIAIEETDAWLIPLFENQHKHDSASHVNAKETLSTLISGHKKKNKFIDTSRKMLNYANISKLLSTNMGKARSCNESLNLFCLEVTGILE